MRPRSISGQAAVEYIAVVCIVAIVFAIAGGFVLNGRAIAAATLGQLKRGLCIVEGHDCPEEHPPCTVSSRGSSDDWHVDVAIVRFGAGKAAFIEHKSDGHVLVTFTDHMDLGATTGFGVGLKLGDKLSLGGEIRGAALASLGHGTTYEVPDDRAANALVGTMRKNHVDPAFWKGLERLGPRVSSPVSKYRQLDLSASGDLKAFSGMAALGGQEDLVTHEKTVYLKGSGSATLHAGPVSADGGFDGQIALKFDRHNRPVDLMVLGAGKLEASADLPTELQPVAGHVQAGRGREWQVEGHLDMTQPGRMDAVLRSLTDPLRLKRMVLEEGTVQFNTYGTATSGTDIGGHVGAELSFGGEVSHQKSRRRLLTAMEHTPEGFWVPRYDCMAAA
jgi:hypothetical protein